ncbi:MAG TPA: DUF3857 domain-containing protein [Candidatus Sulfotelmatobacter sp.]|nr:DUF3857 domain-containing protein [Candidatus Sulfotelmatobacter sp.]
MYKLGALLLLLVAGPSALAQVQAGAKPNPAPSDFSKEAYVFERWQTHVQYEADGTGYRERAAEVRIVSEAGVKAFAVLTFPYTSADETVEFDYIRVRKPDGTVVKTPDYNIQDMPAEVSRAAPLYSDVHEKHVAVKGLSVGDVLEYVVRARVIKPQVPGHFWYETSFVKEAITRDEQLEISVPASKYVKVVSPDFKPEVKEEGGRRIYHWSHSNLVVKEKNPNEMPRRIPPNPDVQLTTFASWEEVGKWYGDLQKDPLQVTPAIQAKAAELTKGLQTDDEKIHAIYNFVALKYHYVGLDFGIGRYQPHAADDVLDNNYGDCKDKHTLLAALLKAAGIEAWPVLIHSYRKLDPEVPSPAQFNHVITVVHRPEENIWLDTTPEVSPYRLILMGLRNKQALMIPSDKPPTLVTTPQNAPFPQIQEFSSEGKLDSSGTFTGHIAQLYRGDSEVVMRTLFRRIPESQWKEAAQMFSYRLNFGGDVSNVKMTPPDEIDKPFEISYDYLRKDYGDWEHHQIPAPLPPIGMEIPKGAKEVKPVEPMLLEGGDKITYHSRMELPAGFTPTVPAECHLSESFAEYNGVTKIEKGLMTTNRQLLVKKAEVALSDWDSFSKFGRALADDEFGFIQLTASPAATPNTPQDLEQRMRDTVKANPSNAALAGTLGAYLMGRGKFADAAKVLEAAVNANPDNSSLEYELGQAYLKASDHEKALTHLRNAVDIKDDDPLVLNNVAYTLAENKTDLALAQEYAEKAVDELDDEARGSESSNEAELRVTYMYSLTWDTLGWVYFQQGDAKRAEDLIQAAWLLGEESIVAEHLGEIHEKEGKRQNAARDYENALAVSASTSANMTFPGITPSEAYLSYEKRENDLHARYKKLTGKEMTLAEIHRLPNGEWTLTPAEQLRRSREVKLANDAKLAGSAQFLVTLKPAKVDSASYESGDEALKPLADKMTKAHFPLEFPSDSGAILVVRLSVRCEAASPCVATLQNPVPVRPKAPFSPAISFSNPPS